MAVASLWLVFFFACLLLLIFLKRSWCFFRPRSSGWSTLQLEYALALRSAVVYVAIGAVPLLFPCSERSASASLKGWDRCPASSYSLVPTNIMRIYHFLPFWYAFLVTPHLGCLISGIHDALLGASTGLCMASLLNLVMPGGAGGTNYLPEDFWQKAWLPFGYHSFAAILFAVCSTYLLFFSSTSVGQKQYALGVFSELLVPFMNPQTTSGFRAVIWDWEFNWNWNGIAMCGFWLVVLAILLAIPSLGLLPWSRESVKRHSCMWSAATELAQLAEDTAGCLEYLLTILQQEAWKFPFHADSSNFYIRQLGMRRTTAEALLEQVAWESWVSGHTREQHKNLQKVAAFLRQLRQLLRIQSGLMRYLGQSTSRGEQFLLEDFVLACSEGLAAVARDCRDKADISTETRLELQRLATKADEVLCKALEKQAKPENAFSSEMAFLDQLRSWAAAFSAFDARQNDAAPSASGGKDANSRHWFPLRNTVSWTLALLWSVYSRGYSMGCVVATSFIFSETSGSSFDTNINRILGVGMGLAVGNVPAILILSGTSADTSSMLRFFAYFVVMFIMWTLAMFGYLAPGSKYYRACLLWVGYGGVQMLRHLPQFDQPDAELFLAILDNIVAIMVVFIVDMVFAYVQGNSTEEQVKAAVTRCAQHVANAVETLQAGKVSELDMDPLQRDIKVARFWDSEIQKEGLVWTRLWQPPYKADSVPALLDCFDEVYVWVSALQNSAKRCDSIEHAAKLVKDILPSGDVDRCHTFVRAIKLVVQGLDESLHELHHLLQEPNQKTGLAFMSSQNLCNLLQGETTPASTKASFSLLDGINLLDLDAQSAKRAPEVAAGEAVKWSTKALRVSLQRIGGLIAAGSAFAARDWRVQARACEAVTASDDLDIPLTVPRLRQRLKKSLTSKF